MLTYTVLITFCLFNHWTVSKIYIDKWAKVTSLDILKAHKYESVCTAGIPASRYHTSPKKSTCTTQWKEFGRESPTHSFAMTSLQFHVVQRPTLKIEGSINEKLIVALGQGRVWEEGYPSLII